jgi:DNA repair protein RadD
VLDFAGNVETHGPITNVREPKKAGEKPGEAPMKVCPECQELVAISARSCPACGHEFPPPEEKVWKLSNADIMRDETPVKTMAVTSWKFSPHTSYTSGKDMIRITYYGALSDKPIHEYMAIFHEGYAGEKAARTLASICNNAGIERDSEDWRGWCDYATENGTPPTSIDYTVDGKFAKVTKRIW